jgi:hypothetical protein
MTFCWPFSGAHNIRTGYKLLSGELELGAVGALSLGDTWATFAWCRLVGGPGARRYGGNGEGNEEESKEGYNEIRGHIARFIVVVVRHGGEREKEVEGYVISARWLNSPSLSTRLHFLATSHHEYVLSRNKYFSFVLFVL